MSKKDISTIEFESDATDRVAGECFYLDENGKRSDADIHNEILDNPEAERHCAEQSAAWAIARGMPRADAERMFGLSPPPPHKAGGGL